MEQRVSLVTLGVADLARARLFYEEGLGWRRANDHPEVAFYQAGGMVLALWGRNALAADAQVQSAGSGFRGIALAYNTRERAEVDAVLAEAQAAGGRIVKPAHDAFWAAIPAISKTPTATCGRSPGTPTGRSPPTAASDCRAGPEVDRLPCRHLHHETIQRRFIRYGSDRRLLSKMRRHRCNAPSPGEDDHGRG